MLRRYQVALAQYVNAIQAYAEMKKRVGAELVDTVRPQIEDVAAEAIWDTAVKVAIKSSVPKMMDRLVAFMKAVDERFPLRLKPRDKQPLLEPAVAELFGK
jgi:hypothetical protein